jgi:hypothetical protein
MSTPDAPAVDYAFWRERIARAEASGGLAVLRCVDGVPPELLRALLDAHEREAAREQSADTLREHQSAGIDRAAREVAERAYAYGPEAVWAAQTNTFAAIIRRNLEVDG